MVKTGEHVKNKLENILPLGWEVNTVVKKTEASCKVNFGKLREE